MEEIMAEEMPLPKLFKDILKGWKKRFWKGWNTRPAEEKLQALTSLIQLLTCLEVNIKEGAKYRYFSDTQTIELDSQHPSLVSTLHEIGHHYYGGSELLACRFSVQLFKAVFPGSFKKLKVDGHRLTL